MESWEETPPGCFIMCLPPVILAERRKGQMKCVLDWESKALTGIDGLRQNSQLFRLQLNICNTLCEEIDS